MYLFVLFLVCKFFYLVLFVGVSFWFVFSFYFFYFVFCIYFMFCRLVGGLNDVNSFDVVGVVKGFVLGF